MKKLADFRLAFIEAIESIDNPFDFSEKMTELMEGDFKHIAMECFDYSNELMIANVKVQMIKRDIPFLEIDNKKSMREMVIEGTRVNGMLCPKKTIEDSINDMFKMLDRVFGENKAKEQMEELKKKLFADQEVTYDKAIPTPDLKVVK